MRLLIDTTYRQRAPFSGTAVYAERLCAALRREDGIEVIEAVNRRRRPQAGGGMGSLRNLLADRVWSAWELPRLARRAGADLIHHTLPAHSALTGLPQVITVHDLAFERLPESFAPGFRHYAHRTHRTAARAAEVVICVSQATARDVRELWGVAPERILVAPHGPGQDIAAAAAPPAGGEYFLYVGDDEPRKNLDSLLSAYLIYRQDAAEPLSLRLAGTVDRVGPGVMVERHPALRRLAELYAGAVALIQPSRYEGFGMTALEAMSVGTAVIASRIPAHLEVCGDAALFVDPADPGELASAMARMADEPALRRSLTEQGRRRAGSFTWLRSARTHLDAYAMALSGGQARPAAPPPTL